MKKIKNIGLLSIVTFFPALASAQYFGGELTSFGNRIINFINGVLVPFLLAVALLLFVYGVYVYFFQQGSESDSRKEGRWYIVWAIIAFVFIVSVWGITNLIAGGLDLDDPQLDNDFIPEAGSTRGAGGGVIGG